MPKGPYISCLCRKAALSQGEISFLLSFFLSSFLSFFLLFILSSIVFPFLPYFLPFFLPLFTILITIIIIIIIINAITYFLWQSSGSLPLWVSTAVYHQSSNYSRCHDSIRVPVPKGQQLDLYTHKIRKWGWWYLICCTILYCTVLRDSTQAPFLSTFIPPLLSRLAM